MFSRAVAALAVVTVFLLAAGGAGAETKSGKCVLKEGIKDAVTVSLGKQVKAECSFYVGEFFGQKIISPQAKITNTGKKPMHYAYYVAFLDKNKDLVGCTSFVSIDKEGLAPGKETFIGNVIQVPPADMKRVAFYLVTLYESEREIGK